MKEKFREYYPFQKDEIKKLWDNSLFIFDTNVILNLYRYSNDTKNEFQKAIIDVKKRLWLPYQVVKEFQKNRLTVIGKQVNIYKEFITSINKLQSELDNKNRNPFISDKLHNEFSNILNKVEKELKDKMSTFENLVNNDTIHIEIADIFDKKVGNDFSSKKLEEIYKKGKERYEKSIPPGYKDIKDKPVPDRYGDLIIWLQIIEKTKTDKTNIIFILDDRKDDWWLQKSGKTISPRPELLKEFRKETGMNCYLYKPFQFLKYSNEYLGSNYKEETIKEIKDFKPKIIKKVIENSYLGKKVIEVIVTISKTKNDLIRYVELIKDAGYHISFKELDNNKYQLIIHISVIPDIERRFKERYLILMPEYGIKLDEYKVI